MTAEHWVVLIAAMIGAVGSITATWMATAAHQRAKPLAHGPNSVLSRLDEVAHRLDRLEQAYADHEHAQRRDMERLDRIEEDHRQYWMRMRRDTPGR